MGQPELKRKNPTNRFSDFWHYYSQNKGAVLGLYFIAFMLIVALFAPIIAPYPPNAQFRDALLVPPFWQDGGSTRFLLGTDALGRDELSRLVFGARYSFYIGFVVVAIAASGGVVIGLIAGFAPRWLDTIIMRIVDIILSFPPMPLALVMVTILGPSLSNAMVAIAIVLQPHYIRLTRVALKTERSKDYVTASQVSGTHGLRLVFKTVMPNCLSPIIVQAALSFSNAILDAASLGFLGMGAQPPTPEWGTMLAESREFILSAWWLVTLPGLAILLSVLAINLVGDGLRDALDPKLRIG